METFTSPREIVSNKHFEQNRKEALLTLNIKDIDEPLIDVVKQFNKLPHCFTLQCCYGHFLYNDQADPNNTDDLPILAPSSNVEYRIAYLAFCILYSDSGRAFYRDLRSLIDLDREYIQFGSAEWFWERQVNSYVLQVEPDRLKTKDRIVIAYEEALHIQKIRNDFFKQLENIIAGRL